MGQGRIVAFVVRPEDCAVICSRNAGRCPLSDHLEMGSSEFGGGHSSAKPRFISFWGFRSASILSLVFGRVPYVGCTAGTI